MSFFILSLDCEGRWGGADKQSLPHNKVLTTDRLRRGYDSIIELLEEFDVPATFAFVGCFVMDESERQDASTDLKLLANRSPYVQLALGSMREDGWSGRWALDAVRESVTRHEIALHGMTHVPWTQISHETACQEMGLLKYAKGLKGLKTFIYPRNEVAHVDVLHKHGMLGYREAWVPKFPGESLLKEFNPLIRVDGRMREKHVPLAVPAGHFVNWRHGFRRAVPVWLSSLRTGSMLARARKDEVVHYWTHPENVVSAPETLSVLRNVVRRAAHARDKGTIEIVTQQQYCEKLL